MWVVFSVVEKKIEFVFVFFAKLFPSTAEPQAHQSSPQSYWNSATFVFQDVESFLVLCLKRHDKVLRGDLPPAILVHLAHEDVVQPW